MNTATIPQPIIDLLDKIDPPEGNGEDGEDEECGGWKEFSRLERLSPRNLIFDGRLVIPDEGWDWEGALKFEEAINLRSVFEGCIANGPRTQIFEKMDSTKPAYVLLRCGGHQTTYMWLEW